MVKQLYFKFLKIYKLLMLKYNNYIKYKHYNYIKSYLLEIQSYN